MADIVWLTTRWNVYLPLETVTRFAPSPTGDLHLGHAYSALVAASLGNGFTLRIDDIDHTRCRPQFVDGIYDDLQWLGLQWQGNPVFQSHRLEAYATALEDLCRRDLIYPCYLSRAELADVLSAPHTAPTATDTVLPASEQTRRAEEGREPAWRLRTADALRITGPLTWRDLRNGMDVPVDMKAHGDVVIARRDIGTSYHLSVVIDDQMDRITLVTRGADLTESTHVHRVLQALLDIQPPDYLHHDLVTDEAGTRLAKRDAARSLRQMREDGICATDIVGNMPKIPSVIEP